MSNVLQFPARAIEPLAPVQPHIPYISIDFTHDRIAPAEWTAALRELSPMSRERGWLELVWEPGDPWRRAERWALWEMIHPGVVDREEVAELEGPHPRSEGHACTSVPIGNWAPRWKRTQPCICRRKTESWRKGPCIDVTLDQWKLYRRTGYVGRPFWVIQGTTGGHKHSFTNDEKVLLEEQGYLVDPPATGALEYAPFDGRVLRQISRFNRLWQFQNNAEEYEYAMGEGYEQYRAGVEKQLRVQLVAHLKEQMADVAAEIVDHQHELEAFARTSLDYDRIAEQNEEKFITTGSMLSERRAR